MAVFCAMNLSVHGFHFDKVYLFNCWTSYSRYEDPAIFWGGIFSYGFLGMQGLIQALSGIENPVLLALY